MLTRSADLLRRHLLLRFLAAGAVNTAVGYGLLLAALAVIPNTTAALAAATVVAVLFSFASNGGYVFRMLEPRRLWRFVAAYALVFIYNAIGLQALKHAGLRPQLGGLVLLPGSVAASYLLNRGFVFRRAR